MPQQYSSTQPKGFNNYIRNVAIVGAAGQQGSHIVNLLLKTGKHTVTAITRADSFHSFPPGIEIKTVDYDSYDESRESHDSIVAGLQGQDALIITVGVTAPRDTVTKLIEAAAEAGVKWIVPNEWGIDTTNRPLGIDTFLGFSRIADRALIEYMGDSSWIAIACGFWYQYSLAIPDAYGFDIQRRTATIYDDGTQKFNTSTWDQVARAVTTLMSMKIYPDDETDTSPTLDVNFRNKFAYVSSFRASQTDMFESLKRVSGTRDEDWKVVHRPSREVYEEAKKVLYSDRSAYVRLLYSRVLYPNGDGDFESKYGLANEVLGLPVEDLDECTRDAIKRSERA